MEDREYQQHEWASCMDEHRWNKVIVKIVAMNDEAIWTNQLLNPTARPKSIRVATIWITTSWIIYII